MNVFCCFALLRVIRKCCCGRRVDWQNMDDGYGNGPAAPLVQNGDAPVQGRIVNGVIMPASAPSAGPAVPSSTTVTPTPTAPAQAVQPAAVFPVAPAAPAAPLQATGFCPSCGTPHPEGHRFCGACGQSLRPAVSAGPAYPQLQPTVSSGPAYPQLPEPGAGLQVQGSR